MAVSEYCVVRGQRQLFLDDVGVQQIENLVRTLHQPHKKGAVIRSSDPRHTIQTRNAPFWDPASACYKLWVTGLGKPFMLIGLHRNSVLVVGN